MEQDLSTVLEDNMDSGLMVDSNDNGANGGSSPKKDGADSILGSLPSEGSRRAKSPHSYSSSSSRVRTPYERPDRSERSFGGDSASRASKYSGMKRPEGRPSNRECRVYVGNLAYEVGWQDLKDFMRKVGEVVFADILTQAGGRSKGCGVVEFATIDEAQRAIKELNDTQFMGRPVFIREDREQEAKFGSGPGRDRFEGGGRGGGGSGFRGGPPGDGSGRTIYVGNLPYIVAWQDLKDLFRSAGNVVRADIMEGQDGRSKGSGTVMFDNTGEARNAISMFDNYEWHGRRLEVREFFGSGGPPSGGGGRGPPPAPYGRDFHDPGYDSRFYGRGPYDPYYGGGGGGGYGGGYNGGGGGGPYPGYFDRGGFGGGGPGGGPRYRGGSGMQGGRQDYYKGDFPRNDYHGGPSNSGPGYYKEFGGGSGGGGSGGSGGSGGGSKDYPNRDYQNPSGSYNEYRG